MSTLFLFAGLLCLCSAYALMRGGAPERIAAGLQLGAYAVGFALPRLDAPGHVAAAAIGSAAIDGVLLVALVALALRSMRFWPLWIAGFHLAAVFAHVGRLLDPAMLPFGYALQVRGWGYPMVLATIVGTWRHDRRRQAGGGDPAWRVSARA